MRVKIAVNNETYISDVQATLLGYLIEGHALPFGLDQSMDPSCQDPTYSHQALHPSRISFSNRPFWGCEAPRLGPPAAAAPWPAAPRRCGSQRRLGAAAAPAAPNMSRMFGTNLCYELWLGQPFGFPLEGPACVLPTFGPFWFRLEGEQCLVASSASRRGCPLP